jgi:luciferase family oxidoreductase group 1
MRYSVLDLAPIIEGGDAALAFRNSLDLAQHAERWGYHRFWLAEHHNMRGIASAATSVVIGYVAGGTNTIRVGAGGVMLPNHAPLVIAEQFGTLESLYPGRIDLALGRAPGTDHATARALRRYLGSTGDTFPQDLMELLAYFRDEAPRVRAVPGAGLRVPIYLLGSSDFSAQLAAELGLPFAFASHFAPDYLHVALELYRRNFKASETLDRPYVIVGARSAATRNVISVAGARINSRPSARIVAAGRQHGQLLVAARARRDRAADGICGGRFAEYRPRTALDVSPANSRGRNHSHVASLRSCRAAAFVRNRCGSAA